MVDRRSIVPRKVLRLAEKKLDKAVISKKKSNRKKMRKFFPTCTRYAIKQIV